MPARRSAILNQMVQQQLGLDRTFAALGDSTRRAILEQLSRSGSATVSDLANPFGITLTGIKKHLGVLEQVGLVSTEKIGRSRHCSLGPSTLADAELWIADYQGLVEARFDRLGRFLQGPARTER